MTTFPSDASSLVQVKEVSAGYGARQVLNAVTMEVQPGECIGLVGPNGSGKSTLLHCITGYHKTVNGSITVGGRQVTGLSRRDIAEHIAFVPQHTDSVYSFTVLDMVMMGRHPFRGFSAVDSPEDVDIALAAMAELEISHLAARRFSRLSGGEKQLVLLARAFAQGAPLLMLDEPLTGLDIRHQFQLMNALKHAVLKPAHAVLATFHDLSVAARWCTRIILLRSGTVIAAGAPASVITGSNLASLYGVQADVSTDAAGYLSIQVRGYTSDGS